jgi:PAS domain S-box-containing protein
MTFQTLVEAMLEAPADKPFVTMFHDETAETVTFGNFIRSAFSDARHFQDQGLTKGDTIILIMPQGVPLMTAFAGAMLLGAVPAILAYPNFKADPKKYSSGLRGVSKNLKARLVLVDDSFPSDLTANLQLDQGAKLIRYSVASSLEDCPYIVGGAEDLAFIQHSAGTTGLQKGVGLSHAAVLRQLEHLASVLNLSDEDRIYSWLPLYHDMGLIACFMLPLVYHLPVVMQSPTEWVLRPGTMLQLITDFRCTLGWIPNFALQFLARRVRRKDAVQYDLSSLRALINCSEPVRARSIQEFKAAYTRYGLKPSAIQSSYAMAENVFAVTQSAMDSVPKGIWVSGQHLAHEHVAVPAASESEGSLCLVSSGHCLPGNRVRIVSADEEDLQDGRVGEILIQSDSLFNGYYNQPELTVTALKDGWYWSGDLGFLLDNELYVIGRKKDLIIVAGKNIYPQDVEEIVSGHPAIHDGRVVAFGLYNADRGTQDIIIVAETETIEELTHSDQIERALRNAVASELDVVPRAVYLKPPKWIVKSTAGKPARSTTREKLLIEHPELLEGLRPENGKIQTFQATEALPQPAVVALRNHEYLLDFHSKSVITRTVDGIIKFWSRRAEELYGWKKEEAIGKVSHDLLQTRFPKPLHEIDLELVRKGRWEGKLVHTTRNGGCLVVESQWTLNLEQQSDAVIEVNRPSTDP